MNNSFKLFIINKNKKLISENRTHDKSLTFGINEGVASLLTFLDKKLQTPVLSWIFGKGLMQASKAREELLKKVKIEIGKNSIKSEMARDMSHIIQKQGNDYDENITSRDLFSPEAWKKNKELGKVKIDGMGIHEYYSEKLEPKEMIIEIGTQGKKYTIDLKKLKKTAEENGLQPFEYGGFNGLIQFIDEGSWLDDMEKERSIIVKNKQYGPDIRPDENDDDDDDDDDNYHYHSGVFKNAIPMLNNAMNVMHNSISEIKDATTPEEIENVNKKYGKDVVERWKKKDTTISGTNRSIDWSSMKGQNEPPIDISKLRPLLTKCLNKPFGISSKKSRRISTKAYKKPEAFGKKINDIKDLPNPDFDNIDGWYYQDYVNDYIIFKLNKEQQAEIIDYIFSPYEETGKINTKFSSKKIKSLKLAEPDLNTKISLTTIINNDESYINNDPLKVTGHKLSVINGGNNTHQIAIAPKKHQIKPAGSNKERHIESNIAGKDTWKKIEAELKKGKQGLLHEWDIKSIGPFKNNFDLPCVINAVNIASNWFNQKRRDHGINNLMAAQGDSNINVYNKAKQYFTKTQLLSWAVESLPQFSNDKAFQIGWQTDKEIEYFIKQKKPWINDSLKSNEIEHLSNGKIIDHIKDLKQNKDKLLIEIIKDSLEKSEDKEIFDNRTNILNYISELGYKYRLRKIAAAVQRRMDIEYNKNIISDKYNIKSPKPSPTSPKPYSTSPKPSPTSPKLSSPTSPKLISPTSPKLISPTSQSSDTPDEWDFLMPHIEPPTSPKLISPTSPKLSSSTSQSSDTPDEWDFLMPYIENYNQKTNHFLSYSEWITYSLDHECPLKIVDNNYFDLYDEEKKYKKVTLNKPFRTPDGPKKFSVYVKNDKGNVVKVNFGDPNMEIKRDNPARRRSYRARHNCDNPGPKWKANYWSCKMWSKTNVSDLT